MTHKDPPPRVVWAGPVCLTWLPDEGALRLTAWKSNRVIGWFTLWRRHLTAEAVQLLTEFIEEQPSSEGEHVTCRVAPSRYRTEKDPLGEDDR